MHRFTLAFLLFFCVQVFASAQADYEAGILLELSREKGIALSTSSTFVPQPSNPLEAIPVGILLAWYYGIQAQSGQSCNLFPPNAIYGARAIVGQHVLPGLLNYFDRIQRCHGLNLGQYSLLPGGNYADGVRNFQYQPVFMSYPYYSTEYGNLHE